jgi:hypothetical protein
MGLMAIIYHIVNASLQSRTLKLDCNKAGFLSHTSAAGFVPRNVDEFALRHSTHPLLKLTGENDKFMFYKGVSRHPQIWQKQKDPGAKFTPI